MYCNKNNEYNNPYMKIYSFIGPTGSIQPNPYDLYVESNAAPGATKV